MTGPYSSSIYDSYPEGCCEAPQLVYASADVIHYTQIRRLSFPVLKTPTTGSYFIYAVEEALLNYPSISFNNTTGHGLLIEIFCLVCNIVRFYLLAMTTIKYLIEAMVSY
jgi:hypothetical protein